MPKITTAQRSGAQGEYLFGAFVARHGGIWSPTGPHSDFGLDGRVEVTDESGALLGAEFGVQIKARSEGKERASDIKRFGRISRNTLEYWLDRITPTLVVGCNLASGEIFAEWAHGIFQKGRPGGQRSEAKQVTLKIPGPPLDAARWRDICMQAVSWHKSLVESLRSGQMDLPLRGLYQYLNEVSEELVELVCWVAMSDVEPLSSRFCTSPEFDGSSEIRRRLLEPPRVIVSGLAPNAVIACIESATAGVSSFRKSALELLGAASPLLPALTELDRWLNLIERQMGVRAPQEWTKSDARSSSQPPGLEWVVADMAGVMSGAIAAVLVIRDFTHEVRRLINPVEVRYEAAKRENPILSLMGRTPAAELLRRWESLI